MLNKVQIIGRLGQDPEVKNTSFGKSVCTFSVATSEQYTNKEGQRQENTEWHNVVCFDKTAENCGKFIGKGSLVYIEGKLKTDKWQDKNGQDRYTTKLNASNVRFLDRKGDNQQFGDDKDDFQSNSSNEMSSTDFENYDYDKIFPTDVSEMDDAPF